MKQLTGKSIKKILGYFLEPIAYRPGHFYSPIVARKEILTRQKQIFDINKKEVEGVDLNESEQLHLLEAIKSYYNEMPFGDEKKKGLRYYFNNRFYSYGDAIFLYSVIRHFCPDRIIEVGSGFSSALMLDINEHFLQNKIKCSFIDPYPERLLTLLKDIDRQKHKIIKSMVQDIDPEFFKQLKANDILFIDSSHVSKTGSDVNYIFGEILPALNRGVLIHFHDIFYPFEYPRDWVLEGRGWNEDYILKAFLQYNSSFKVVLFNTFLEFYHEEWFADNMPLCLKNKGGGIWLRKI